jgi:hypothetical protein
MHAENDDQGRTEGSQHGGRTGDKPTGNKTNAVHESSLSARQLRFRAIAIERENAEGYYNTICKTAEAGSTLLIIHKRVCETPKYRNLKVFERVD